MGIGRLIGSMVSFAWPGCLGQVVDVGVRAGRIRMLALAVVLYAFMLTSFATSVYFHTAPTVGLFVFATYVLVAGSTGPQPSGAAAFVGAVPIGHTRGAQ